MKSYFISVFLLFGCLILPAQNKEDNIWVLGYNPNDSVLGYGGTRLDFSQTPVKVSYFPISIGANSSVEICNPRGEFQFFSNGCKIINYAGELINNSDTLNPGYFYDEWCGEGAGYYPYKVHQGMIALPWPDQPESYAMFHLAWYLAPQRIHLRDMYVTRVDMNANNGLGNVTEKNTLLLQDTNLMDNITAVRHGNGRDWWIVEPRGLTDTMYMFLLTPFGIKGPYIEETGLSSKSLKFTAGQAVFSPDGTKYVRVNKLDGVDIFDFDRCRGKFVYAQRLPFPGEEQDGIMGAAISPSSRYLYVTALTKLFQYDLFAENVEASKVLIDEYDWFLDTLFSNLQTSFYQQMLGPDGKIYISIPNTTAYLHIIHSPDSTGKLCDFRQHDLELPARHGFCVPNFPHFRLYDLPASPCDSLGIDAPEEYRVFWHPTDAIRLYPNPTGTGTVAVTIPPGDGGVLRAYNAAGQFLVEHRIEKERIYSLDCSAWPNGVYVVTFSTPESRRPLVARLVVCR